MFRYRYIFGCLDPEKLYLSSTRCYNIIASFRVFASSSQPYPNFIVATATYLSYLPAVNRYCTPAVLSSSSCSSSCSSSASSSSPSSSSSSISHSSLSLLLPPSLCLSRLLSLRCALKDSQPNLVVPPPQKLRRATSTTHSSPHSLSPPAAPVGTVPSLTEYLITWAALLGLRYWKPSCTLSIFTFHLPPNYCSTTTNHPPPRSFGVCMVHRRRRLVTGSLVTTPQPPLSFWPCAK